MKLKDKVALVTGAGDGIGKAIALELSEQGAGIGVVDINIDKAKGVAETIKSKGGQAIVVQTDVTQYEQVKEMAVQVRQGLGEIDILVNNAPGMDFPRLAWEKPIEMWHTAIAGNLHSVFYSCHELVGRMVERRWGRVINISSCAGIMGAPNLIGYSSGKAGIFGFTKTLAKEVGMYGVTVNSVSPGPIGTEIFMSHIDEKRREWYADMAGIGRIGRPEEVAKLVAFLASEDAAFITGQDHVIAGLRNLGK